MRKLGIAGMIAGALSAAVIGFAGPAHADGSGYGNNGFGFGGYGNGYGYYGHDRSYPWMNQLFPHVKVPHVDTTPRH